MPSTINGIGTTFIGREDEREDGTYVTTEYVTIFWIPILAIKKYRVKEVSKDENLMSSKKVYIIYEEQTLKGNSFVEIGNGKLILILMSLALMFLIAYYFSK